MSASSARRPRRAVRSAVRRRETTTESYSEARTTKNVRTRRHGGWDSGRRAPPPSDRARCARASASSAQAQPIHRNEYSSVSRRRRTSSMTARAGRRSPRSRRAGRDQSPSVPSTTRRNGTTTMARSVRASASMSGSPSATSGRQRAHPNRNLDDSQAVALEQQRELRLGICRSGGDRPESKRGSRQNPDVGSVTRRPVRTLRQRRTAGRAPGAPPAPAPLPGTATRSPRSLAARDRLQQTPGCRRRDAGSRRRCARRSHALADGERMPVRTAPPTSPAGRASYSGVERPIRAAVESVEPSLTTRRSQPGARALSSAMTWAKAWPIR